MEILQNGFCMIPNVVLYDNELSDKQKLLYGTISSLCAEKGYCWASNDYIGELLGVNKWTISKNIAVLEQKGYIHITLDSNYKRYIELNSIVENHNACEKSQGGLGKITRGGCEKSQDINISDKYKINNNENSQEQTQEINNSLPKQDNNITQNLTNGNLTYTIDDIWEAYPSIPKRKGTKQNAEKSLAKKTDEEKRAMMFDMKILKLEYRYKIEDITRGLTCSHWIDNYTIQDEHEIDNRLRKIIAYHMSNTDDKEKMKKRYNDICSIFGEDKVKAFVKEYGRIKNKITLNIN